MSDERDSADAAGDGSGTEAAAVATRPLRPSGKRSRSRAARTRLEEGAGESVDSGDAKAGVTKDGSGAKAKTPKAKTAKKSSGPSRNPIAFVFNYLKQVVAELRKVIWPNRKQMVTYTSVVLVFLAFMVTLIGVADLGLARIVLLVFGN